MQRDKKGRFVKKATGGTQLLKDTLTLRNGKTYKLKQGMQANLQQDSWLTLAMQNPDAYEQYLSQYYDPVDASSPASSGGEVSPTNSNSGTSSFSIPGFNASLLTTPIKLDYNLNAPVDSQGQFKLLQQNKTYGLGPEQKIKVTQKDGKYYDERGVEVPLSLVMTNPNSYEIGFLEEFKDYDPSKVPVKEDSKGMNLKEEDPLKQSKNQDQKPLDKTKMANFLEFARAGIGAAVNNKVAERALEAEKPFLQDVSESHRSVYGDYRAQVEGEKAAAKLRNMASKPLTADGALQQQMMLDAQIKGQEYIDKGNAQDEAIIKQTREAAWAQEKENAQQRQAVAMQNRQAMLMSQKNKAQIENARDSANFSQVAAPLMMGIEQRLRNEGKIQKAYQDHYNDALVQNDVYNTFRDGLTDTQKTLVNTYQTSGLEGLTKYLKDNNLTETDWLQTQKILNNEIIRRKAALKGAYVNPTVLGFGQQPPSDLYGIFSGSQSLFKKGGTIYKAKLSKRTKDNDRGAKSVESSKKIAARFLEKAIDSLYSYDDVELIAKPKNKKRKYQAGGGLPFVNFAPVFATDETGAPSVDTKKDEKKDDLTSKDVLQLLKDMDGLPADMQVIVSSLKNFDLADKMDPLGLSSSSDIASRYISLINKIKVAKFNREEYNNAFNQLKGNGGLNEYAVTSEGYLIGSNQEGDFEMFTPDQVNAGVPKEKGYSLLTNSNLLYLRANSADAAFNHKLTTFAQNGIGMEVITKQVSDIIQGLGKSKESEEGFLQMGNNGSVKKGIQFLQKAAKEVGDSKLSENMSVADYYHAGYLTEEQAEQAELALQYIWSALPANAKSILQVKGGSAKGAQALLQSLVYSKTSSTVEFKTTPKKLSKDGSSTSSDGVDKLKLSPVQMMQVGYTDRQQVTLQKGTKYATVVNAQVLPITDVNKKLLGVTTLDKVASSTFGGALDMNNVTMGSQLIDPHAMQNVQIDSTNLYIMNLPIDKNSPDGTIKPDLAWMSKMEEIDKVIRDQNITDPAQINQLYTDAGLPVLMDSNGQLNIKDYCKFGVLNGHALNSAFKDLDLLDNTISEIEDEKQIENVLSILNKDRGEKDRLKFDSKSWLDSLVGTAHDQLFEGTIYIPVRTNAFTGMIGGGEYPTTETAAEVEALVKQKERTRGYIDPGLLT